MPYKGMSHSRTKECSCRVSTVSKLIECKIAIEIQISTCTCCMKEETENWRGLIQSLCTCSWATTAVAIPKATTGSRHPRDELIRRHCNDWRMAKDALAYTHNWMLQSDKKCWNIEAWGNLDGIGDYFINQNKIEGEKSPRQLRREKPQSLKSIPVDPNSTRVLSSDAGLPHKLSTHRIAPHHPCTSGTPRHHYKSSSLDRNI